jgi:hypothetical protein
MATVLEFKRPTGRTALQWHKLRVDSVVAGRPIVCVACQRPHKMPPRLGRCPCGGYTFDVQASGQLPLLLDELAPAPTAEQWALLASRADVHGGE